MGDASAGPRFFLRQAGKGFAVEAMTGALHKACSDDAEEDLAGAATDLLATASLSAALDAHGERSDHADLRLPFEARSLELWADLQALSKKNSRG
jgi:hypothetical protein